MFKVNNKDTRTIKIPVIFIVNFGHISHLVLIVNFEQVNPGWKMYTATFCNWVTIHNFLGMVAKFRLYIFCERKKNTHSRSSRLEVFCRKKVHGNFAKFTGKHLCQSLFFNKDAGLSLQLY